MSFDWKDFLKLAEMLKDQSSLGLREARIRTCVGRAYFAAFCVARDYAERHLGFQPTRRAEDHKSVMEKLKEKKNDAASCLARLRQWRNECDYKENLAGKDMSDLVTSALKDAHRVVKALHS